MRRLFLLTLLLALLAGFGLSRFYPKIERLEVSGLDHYNKKDVLALAGLEAGGPLLWVTPFTLRRLAGDPWIAKARIIRHWPDTVSVTVWERRPAVRQGAVVYALDGTVLPNVTERKRETLTRLEGWGGERLDEGLELARLLADFEPEVISYSPSGFSVRFADTTIFTPGVADLKRHWAGFISQQGKRISVYPWGVSVKQ